jgi:hypothetical protein
MLFRRQGHELLVPEPRPFDFGKWGHGVDDGDFPFGDAVDLLHERDDFRHYPTEISDSKPQSESYPKIYARQGKTRWRYAASISLGGMGFLACSHQVSTEM